MEPELGAGTGPQSADDAGARGRLLLNRAVGALGGQKYLEVKSVVGTGLYYPFGEKGERGQVLPFVDYIVYPDRERTEFGKGKKKTVRANVGSTGWFYDGEMKKLRDQTPDEIAEFQRGLAHNVDTILRAWDRPGIQVRALEETQLWFRQRGMGIELTLPVAGGASEVVTVYIDPDNYRPVKVAFAAEEDRLYLYQSFDGVQVPLTIDHYKAGVQTARIRYDGIDLDRPIDLKLFEKPPGANKVR